MRFLPTQWTQKFGSSRERNPRRRRQAARVGRHLRLEPLEERTVLSAGWLANSYGVGGDPGTDIALDGNGSVYVCGFFDGTTNFTPTADGDGISLTSDGTDAFVAKLNPNGQFIWARRMGGPGDDRAWTIEVTEDGNVYAGGWFHDTAAFGDTQQLTSAGYRDIFVTKLDTNGNFQWAVRAGAPNAPDSGYYDDMVAGMALDTEGAIYLSGGFVGTADFGPDITVQSLGDQDGFLAKLTDTGSSADFQWVQTMGTETVDLARDVAVGVGSDGDKIYVSGEVDAWSDDPDWKRFVTRYSPDGVLGWTWEAPGGNSGGMTVYQETDDTHYIYTTVNAGPQYEQRGVAKLDAGGNEVGQWAEPTLYIRDLAADSEGVYVTGMIPNRFNDFDPDPSATADMYFYGYETYVWKLGHNGGFRAARKLGGESAYGVAVYEGDIYTTGGGGTSDQFDIGTGFVLPTVPDGSGSQMMFVLKTSQDMGGIFGRAFNDLDNDGLWGPGEPPLAGFTVSAVADGVVQATTSVESPGQFRFPHLAPNTSYDVEFELPDDWTQTAGGLQGVTFQPGQFISSKQDSDYFGAYMPNASFHYESTDVPKRIPNRNWKNLESTIDISDSYPIFGLELDFTISGETPTWLELIAPDGTLFGVNTPSTSPIQTDVFNYKDVNGTWTLSIRGGVTGSLTAWSLDVIGGTPPPNASPTAVDDAAITTEDTAVVVDVLANDTDPDGDSLALTAVLVDQASNGTVALNGDGSFTYTPAPDFNGADSFTYVANDGQDDSNVATVTITVDQVQDGPPTAEAGGPYTVAQGGTVTLDASGTTDPDLPYEALVYAWDFDNDGQFDDATGASPTFDAAELSAGQSATVGLQVTDSAANTSTDTATIDVSAAPSGTALYVSDIDFASKAGGKFWQAVFVIRADSNGDGVADAADSVAVGVAITVEFAGKTYTGTTDSDGIFRTDLVKDLGSGSHYAEVVDLVLPDHYWDPLALDLVQDDSDGDKLPDAVLPL